MSTLLRERNQKMAAYASANPCATLQEIGDYHGLTRERVRQILQQEGVHKLYAPTAKVKVRLCIECKKPLRNTVKGDHHALCVPMVTLACKFCGQSYQRRLTWVSWALLNNERYKFTNPQCSRTKCPGQQVTEPCAYCSKTIALTSPSQRYLRRKGKKRFFCSRSHSSLHRWHGAAK